MPQGLPDSDRNSLLPDALRSITRFVAERPRATLWVVVLVACGAIGLTLTSLDFKTERADLIDPQADFHQRWLNYTEQFGDETDLVVVIEGDKPQLVTAALDDLGQRMEKETDSFQNVLYKVDPREFPMRKGLQFQSPAQLERGLKQLNELRPFLQNRWAGLELSSTFTQLHQQYSALSNRPDQQQRLMDTADRLTFSLSSYLNDPTQFFSPWQGNFGSSLPTRKDQTAAKYFLNAKGTMGFLKAFPVESEKDFNGSSQPIQRLRELIAEVSKKHPQVSIGMTGIPVLENDEMRKSRADMSLAAIISFAGVGVLLFLGFRGFRHPLLALAMLALGMAWAFGYTTLVVGHLNILSLSFAVILVGLGIDFAIHYLARYLELRHDGEELQPALMKSSASVGAGVVTAAITTAFAFFSATFTQFLGIAELGIIAGGGILLCALATFVVLPALISLADREVEPRRLPTPFQGKLLRRFIARFPLVVTFSTVIVIAGVGLRIFQWRDGQLEPRIRYDYNLLNLQAQGLESVQIQQRVFDDADHSLLYAVSIADSAEEARALKQKFEKLPTVHHVDELATALPSAPNHQTRLLVQGYRSILAGVPATPPTLEVNEPAAIGQAIERFYIAIRNNADPLTQKVAKRIDTFLNRFEQLSLTQQKAFIQGFQQRLVVSLHGQLSMLAAMTNTEPVSIKELPEALTSRFVSKDGKWLLQIYPKNQIWDVEPLKKFVDDVRSVDPDVTGTPLQNLEASRQIKMSYKTAALYALAVIVLVLLVDFLDRDYTLLTLLSPLAVIVFTLMILKTHRLTFNPMMLVGTYVAMAVAIAAIFDFRNLRDALLAMVPPLGGGLLMFGILAFMQFDLNPANLIVLPLVLGIGVDDGVHVIHDFRAQRDGYRMSPSTMNAIVLTSLTSMIGFGSMMVAAHRGLYGVGLVLVIGVGSCLFVSLVTLPAALTLLARRQKSQTEQTQASNAPSQPGKPNSQAA